MNAPRPVACHSGTSWPCSSARPRVLRLPHLLLLRRLHLRTSIRGTILRRPARPTLATFGAGFLTAPIGASSSAAGCETGSAANAAMLLFVHTFDGGGHRPAGVDRLPTRGSVAPRPGDRCHCSATAGVRLAERWAHDGLHGGKSPPAPPPPALCAGGPTFPCSTRRKTVCCLDGAV